MAAPISDGEMLVGNSDAHPAARAFTVGRRSGPASSSHLPFYLPLYLALYLPFYLAFYLPFYLPFYLLKENQ